MFRIVFFATLGFYIGTNVYLARILGRWLGLSGIGAVAWYLMFALLAMGCFLARFSFLPAAVRKALELLGGWYMGAYILLLVLVPITHLLLRGKNGPLTAGLLLVAAVVYVLAGIWNAGHIRTTSYTVDTAKVGDLRIALISDLHAGGIIGAEQIQDMVDRINAIDADIVLMAGDLFDVEGPKSVPDLEAVGEVIKSIRSRQGVYAVFGNHDAGFDHQDAYAQQLMEDWGMTVLRDEIIELENTVIIGRRDRYEQRRSIEELMAGVDANKYIILMDHQPYEVEGARDAGVDLLVCGHTHGGQVFPANLITDRMYTIDYGILREGKFTAIVSSGAGTWGPRMRIATISEVVSIKVE